MIGMTDDPARSVVADADERPGAGGQGLIFSVFCIGFFDV
jgi:hypothetical protein